MKTLEKSLSDFAETDAQVGELKRQIETLSRQLYRARVSKADLVQAVRDACAAAAAGLSIPPVRAPKFKEGKSRTEEKAIITLGDMQLAKVTPSYNTEICGRRVETYADVIRRITEIQRADHPVRDAILLMIGDMIEGELIFPHQAYQIDAGLYTQLMLDGPRILITFIRSLLAVFRQIHIVAIPGNHGQFGGPMWKHYNPETNADRMLYRYVQQALAAEPRVSWQIPYAQNEAAWYAVTYPFGPENGHGIMTFHGNQIPNAASASTGTIARRIWGYASGAIPEPFEIVVYGHWHTPRYIPLNRFEVFCNGSTESTNTYAQERLSAIGQPVQLLTFIHPRVGITAHHWCKLERERIELPQSYDLPKAEAYPPVPMPKGL